MGTNDLRVLLSIEYRVIAEDIQGMTAQEE